MRRTVTTRAIALFAFLAAATAAAAEPIKLKLAFFSSDRAAPYAAGIKPFIDAVNAGARGLLEIQLYPSGVLGKDIALQPQLVLDGGADLAFIVPGYTPQLFPDNAAIEMPGLYGDGREATYVFTRLIAEKALRGYRDFFVVGAYATGPETLHGRVPMASIEDLKGKRIRVNNASEALALTKLGAIPVAMQITDIAGAMSSGTLDATTMSPGPLADFGISRVETHHFLLPTSAAPLALVMNREVFDKLPREAQAVIAKYSGSWAAERLADTYARLDDNALEQLRADPKRQVVFPSPADRKRIDAAFRTAREELVVGNPHDQSLLRAVENELENLRLQ